MLKICVIIVNSILCYSVFLPAIAYGADIGFDMEKQIYPVLGNGQETVLAVGVVARAYAGETTLEDVRHKVAELSEKEKLEIPEYVLLKELDLAGSGDIEGVLELYATEADKAFAKNERWYDFDQSVVYIKANIVSYVLKAKLKFGPYVFIKYKPILKEGRSFAWSVILKKTDKGYLFSNDLDKNHIFLIAAGAFPYWHDEKVRNNCGSLSSMKKTTVNYQEPSKLLLNDDNLKDADLELYYKVEDYAGTSSISQEDKVVIQKNFETVLTGYKVKDVEKVVSVWDVASRDRMKKRLMNEELMKTDMEYFRDISRIVPEYYLQSGDMVYVYATPVDISGKQKATSLFIFNKTDDGYLFNYENGRGDPYPKMILNSDIFKGIINDL